MLMLALACAQTHSPPTAVRVNAPVHPDLAAHAALFERAVLNPVEGVYVAVGYALANVILIEGDEGVIIVDTTESRNAAADALAALRAVVDKPVSAIVLTHNHADHVFGGAVFAAGRDIPVYAHEDTEAGIDRIVNVLRDAIQVRSMRMFGSLLSDTVNAGIGMHLRFDVADIALQRPSETFSDRMTATVEGVTMELVHAPGETDDQIFVWLPAQRTLLPADNIYQAFPNLYTIRGTPHRDVRRWYQSLDQMRDLQPAVLVPQHTRPVVGEDAVSEVLTAYRDAIQYVHDQTVRGINQGRSPDELAATIRLPPHLAAHPWLQEHYGRVPWSVRSVYAGYLGWFDGDSATLEPLPPDERARRYVDAFAAGQPLPEQAQAALGAGEFAWAAELARLWSRAEPDSRQAPLVLAAALEGLATGHVNPNARNWYLTEALELRGAVENVPSPTSAPPMAFIDSLPTAAFMQALATRLRAEDVLDTELVVSLSFTDVDEEWVIHVRRGVAEIRPRSVPAPDLRLTTTSVTWRRLLAGKINRVGAFASGAIELEGPMVELVRFLSWFR